METRYLLTNNVFFLTPGILFVYSWQEANVNSSNPLIITNTTHIVMTKITNKYKYMYVCIYKYKCITRKKESKKKKNQTKLR